MKKLLRFVVIPVLATALTFAGGVAQANGELEVDQNDPDCNNISGDPFCDIQPAVDAASPGDEIEVEEGTYTENVVITTADIRLDGDDATLDGTGLGMNPGIGIHVMGTSGVEIRGFIVENFDIGVVLTNVYHSRLRDIETRFNDGLGDPFSHDGLQVINSHQNLISDVFAHDNGHNGITLGVGSTNNTLEENISNLNGTNPAIAILKFGCGIELRSDGNNNNSITENEILGNGWGILLGFGAAPGADDNIIEENEIHGNARQSQIAIRVQLKCAFVD